MKILTRYVLKEHLTPFLFAFFTATFLLIIDLVPRIVDQVIDKNLSLWIVLEIIGLNLAWMLALSVPMAVLVATLMAFGRLSSDLEITAMKACGVNLLQVLIPLLVTGFMIAVAMVIFNDRVLPDMNKRSRILTSDIQAMHPTFIFRPGIFVTNVPGYLILTDKIDHATSRVEGVRITETKIPSKPRIIVAEYGFLKVLNGGKEMEFTLFNGEIHSLDTQQPDNYRKVHFENQVINVTGAGTDLVRTDSDYRTKRDMSLDTLHERVDVNVEQRTTFKKLLAQTLAGRCLNLLSDTFSFKPASVASDSAALYQVKSDAAALMRAVESSRTQVENYDHEINKYVVEIYKKYSIPAASLAFILVGAPLGILARRAGMGMAISISIFLFIVYWASLIEGEDLSQRGLMSPFWAMWAANILFGGLGLYLLYIVVSEQKIFAFFRRST